MRIFFVFLFLLTPATVWAESVTITVKGMVCSFCAQGIKKTFGKESAVGSGDVKLDEKIVSLKFRAGESIDDERLKTLIADAGYNVEKIERDRDE